MKLEREATPAASRSPPRTTPVSEKRCVMAKTLEVDRAKAVGLLVALGLKKAPTFNEAKLLGKLQEIDDSDDTADPGKFEKTFQKIVLANKKGHEIELIGDEPATKSAKPAGKPAAKKGKPAAAKGKAESNGKAERKPRAAAGPSNKERLYREWTKRKGDAKDDVKGIMKAVGVKRDAVKDTTVKAWMSGWRNGRRLPAFAKHAKAAAEASKGGKKAKKKSR
jgi:hypothetical protein